MMGFSYIFILFAFIGLLSFVFWIWILIDCAKNETDIGNTRLIWVIIIFFNLYRGSFFLYYFIRRPKRLLELGK